MKVKCSRQLEPPVRALSSGAGDRELKCRRLGLSESAALPGPARTHQMRAPVRRPRPCVCARRPASRRPDAGRRARRPRPAPAPAGSERHARAAPLLRRLAGKQLDAPPLEAYLAGVRVGVVLAAGEQSPGDAGQLAGDGDDGHLAAAPGRHPLAEGAQRPGRAHGRVGGLAERARAAAGPSLEMRPMRAGLQPDWRTRGSRPR